MNNKEIGTVGETSAVNFLLKNKYRILEKNYKTKIGEIDIIAKDKEYIIFIEVKTRSSLNYGLPCQAVHYKKQQVIGKVASLYACKKMLNNQSFRFDVIEVLIKDNKIEISHIKDAFQPNI